MNKNLLVRYESKNDFKTMIFRQAFSNIWFVLIAHEAIVMKIITVGSLISKIL